MLITNEERKKQIDLFIDEDHSVMDKFYEITDRDDLSDEQLIKEMLRLIELDKDFYDPYLELAEIYSYNGSEMEAAAVLLEAYERAIKRIVDSKGRWPKEMFWGFLENRHLMRTIEAYAILCWDIGQTDEALDIFRRLLRANPDDNQGARFSILAIKMGLSREDWQKPLEAEHDGEVVGIDGFKLHDWYEKNYKNFPEKL